MKNRLSDLNDHLFAQMERLSEEGITPEQIETEVKRGTAIVAVADQIIRGGEVRLKAARLLADEGHDFSQYLPEVKAKGKLIEGTVK